MPYIKKHGKNPVTGLPLTSKDLFKLKFHKNTDGQYACPVTGKVFNEHTHIVAIKPSGTIDRIHAPLTMYGQVLHRVEHSASAAFIN